MLKIYKKNAQFSQQNHKTANISVANSIARKMVLNNWKLYNQQLSIISFTPLHISSSEDVWSAYIIVGFLGI